jgi:serine/threonine protein kinase
LIGEHIKDEYITLWSIQILKGLDFLHNLSIDGQQKGIIHRDIKPA